MTRYAGFPQGLTRAIYDARVGLLQRAAPYRRSETRRAIAFFTRARVLGWLGASSACQRHSNCYSRVGRAELSC